MNTTVVVRPPPPAYAGGSPGKKKTLRILLAIMAGMAALTLVFALYTQQIRRQRDFKDRSDGNTELTRKPAELIGLGYLPQGSSIVLGIHVAALNEDPTGRALLREPRPALMENLLGVLERFGLKLVDVDHVVAGTELRQLPPELTTVIVTRKPYAPAEIEAAIKAQKVSATTYCDKPLFYLDGPGVPKLWLAAPNVLVWTTLKKEDLDRIPATLKDPPATLAPATREALVDRLGKQSRLWAVGDLEPARKPIELGLALGVFPKDQMALLRLVKSFAVGVTPHEDGESHVLASFLVSDSETVPALAKYLESIDVQGAKSQKVVTPPPEVKDAAEQWVTWQMRAHAETLRDALGKLHLGFVKPLP